MYVCMYECSYSDAEFNEPFKYGIMFPAMGVTHTHCCCSKSVICNQAVMHTSAHIAN